MSLSQRELALLKTVARRSMNRLAPSVSGHSAEDLLAEAVTRTAAGQRHWRDGVDFCTHLIGCMRSISYNWHRTEEVLVHEEQDEEKDFFDSLASQGADPERILAAAERLDQIRSIFAPDAETSQIVELLAEGYTGNEIREWLGLSAMQYAAAIRRIRRKVSKLSKPGPRQSDDTEHEGSNPQAHPAGSHT